MILFIYFIDRNSFNYKHVWFPFIHMRSVIGVMRFTCILIFFRSYHIESNHNMILLCIQNVSIVKNKGTWKAYLYVFSAIYSTLRLNFVTTKWYQYELHQNLEHIKHVVFACLAFNYKILSFNIAFYRCRNCGPWIYTRAKLYLTESHLLCHKPSWHINCKRQEHESRDENKYAQRKEARTWGFQNIQISFFGCIQH